MIGDRIRARAMKMKKNYGFARLMEVLEASKDRVMPECPVARQCGGCQLQGLSYSEQLHFKEQKIRNNLIRIGGFDAEYIDERMQPIVGMEEPFHYRNKAQYPIGTDRDGNVITGFYAGRTHTIIANTDCALGASENQQILETILSYMHKNKVTNVLILKNDLNKSIVEKNEPKIIENYNLKNYIPEIDTNKIMIIANIYEDIL